MIPELEIEFKKTCKLLLGSELPGSMDEYAKWLGRRVPLPYVGKSAISGKDVWLAPPLAFANKKFNLSKIISMEEMDQKTDSPFKPSDLKNADLETIAKNLVKPVSFYCGNYRYKTYMNVEKCSGAGAGVNLYYSEDAYIDIKNIGYCNYVLSSTNLFGCHAVPQSNFCIHAYNSVNISRCLEVDGCSNSSDLLFCHNCEGMSDSILCFNSKNLRHAVGNQELGREEYLKVKGILLGMSLAGLNRKNSLILTYSTLGAGRR